MSTLLVVSGVISAALVLVMGIALGDSDQPATIRRRPHRARPRRRQGPRHAPQRAETPPSAEPTVGSAPPAAPAFQPPDQDRDPEPPPSPDPPPPAAPPRSAREAGSSDAGRRTAATVPVPVLRSPSGRVRSGIALVVMIACLGTLVALVVGGAVALTAQALRHAVG